MGLNTLIDTEILLKLGEKIIIVRFTNETIGFVYFRHAKKFYSDECDSLPSKISIQDSEGRYKIDEDGWTIGFSSEISIQDTEGS